MGAVFAARHLELDELVAIKVMLPEIAINAETAARFLREARASVRIKSDHIVRVFDVSRLEDGTPYMVMEYLEGSNLEEAIQKSGPLDVESAARHLIQACDAIAAAHAIGIVHRDLKPQNLFLAKQSDETHRIKVLDFGISKLTEQFSAADATLTKTSCAMGSPVYMAPEQMQSAKDVDHRADIWALGCSLFELLIGRPPFNAATMPELCAAVLTHPAPVPSELRRDLPKAIDAIVRRCLEKAPSARYLSVAELAQALLPFAPQAGEVVACISRRRSSMPPPSPVAVNSVEVPSGLSLHTQTTFGQRTGSGSRRSSVVVWLALAAVGLLVLGLFLTWTQRSGKSPNPALRDAAVGQVEPPRSFEPESVPTTIQPRPTADADPSAHPTPAPVSSERRRVLGRAAELRRIPPPSAATASHAATPPVSIPSDVVPPKRPPSLEIGIK
jgi:eukaryotic-like serine/threonine-protein kinase